jgi:hypothetical protein
MANKEEYDRYAAELTKRFDELTRWAIDNWPRPNFPLMSSDFEEGRREISEIVGPRLGDADPPPPSASEKEQGQYVGMNPMPWP